MVCRYHNIFIKTNYALPGAKGGNKSSDLRTEIEKGNIIVKEGT